MRKNKTNTWENSSTAENYFCFLVGGTNNVNNANDLKIRMFYVHSTAVKYFSDTICSIATAFYYNIPH